MAANLHATPGPRYVKHPTDTRRVGEYTITHPDDIEPFSLRSALHLPGRGYILLDKANRNIKYVDANFATVDVLQLETCPFDLCCSNKIRAEFYVTEPDTQRVHCMTTTEKGKLRIKKSMLIEEECRGVACWKSGVAVAVMREGFRGTLGLLDYNGKIKKKVWETEIHTNLFKAPWYLASIKKGTEIVVSDQGNHSVIGPDTVTLTTVFIFKSDALIGPRSLCVDSRDQIYVIGSNEACHNVVKLSPTGRLTEVVLSRKDKLNYPSGIAYNATDDTIVLQTNREKPTVTVYQL